MKKLFLLGLLSLFIHSTASAFNKKDLEQLQTTCSCPNCDLSHVSLPNFILGNNKTLNITKAKKDNQGMIICDLSHANFSGATLPNAYFSPSDFGPGINAKVGKIILEGTNFSHAKLMGSHFNAVYADSSLFNHANLNNVTMLKGASFKHASFRYAQMTHMSIAPPMGGCGALFNESDFSYARLCKSILNADFTQTNFSYANLSYCKLITCDDPATQSFNRTNFYKSNLIGAKTNSKIITPRLLPNAKLCRTRFSIIVSNRDC